MEFLKGFNDDDEKDDPLAATKLCFFKEIKASNGGKYTTAENS